VRKGLASHFCAEAVPNSHHLFNAQILPEVLDGRLDNGIDALCGVFGEPGGKVDLPSRIVAQQQRIARKEVWQHRQVAIVGEVVGEQLAVADDAEDVADEDDGGIGVLVVLGIHEIRRDC
jgi:hypothetical protein